MEIAVGQNDGEWVPIPPRQFRSIARVQLLPGQDAAGVEVSNNKDSGLPDTVVLFPGNIMDLPLIDNVWHAAGRNDAVSSLLRVVYL